VVRAALLSDVHGNLVALEAVLAELPPVDELWVMGDTAGYGPDPADVLALLRERGAHVVAGNHDRAAATGEGLELFNASAAEAARLHHSWLSAEDRDRLAGLPLTLQRGGFTLVHGSLREPLWEYVFEPSAAAATLELAGTPHCCNGHTHLPAVFRLQANRVSLQQPRAGVTYPLGGRVLLNPGSVGQPRDGDPRAAYAVLDTDTGTATFARTSYAVHETQRRILARGLPEFLAERLAVGL
jgi:diadenosine tetraphosphatase ApaH/serine/threonine PP2A family protein phosphatase